MDIRMSDMLEMQRRLQKKYEGQWAPVEPGTGRQQLLWAIGEIGEVIDIIKKKGDDRVMSDPAIRADFVEEFTDVMMYLGDVLLCYGVSAEEISDAYVAKHEYNMRREYKNQTHSDQKHDEEQ